MAAAAAADRSDERLVSCSLCVVWRGVVTRWCRSETACCRSRADGCTVNCQVRGVIVSLGLLLLLLLRLDLLAARHVRCDVTEVAGRWEL